MAQSIERSEILDKRQALMISVMKLIHPVVTPFDLSESSMKAQWFNNPYYRRAVESVVDFIESKCDT